MVEVENKISDLEVLLKRFGNFESIAYNCGNLRIPNVVKEYKDWCESSRSKLISLIISVTKI